MERNRADEVVDPESVELLWGDVDLSWRVGAEVDVLFVSLPETPPTGLDNAYTLRHTTAFATAILSVLRAGIAPR